MIEFTKFNRVAFTVRGWRLEGTVVRTRKSDGMVTVNAPTMYRMSDGTPMVDYREEMYWDVKPTSLEHIQENITGRTANIGSGPVDRQGMMMKTYDDITRAYADVHAVRAAGHGASLTVDPTLVITVTFYAPKKVIRKILMNCR